VSSRRTPGIPWGCMAMIAAVGEPIRVQNVRVVVGGSTEIALKQEGEESVQILGPKAPARSLRAFLEVVNES